MEILRIKPTPSPNTMKVVLSYTREDKLSNTYKKVEENQPRFINQLLSIDGITSIFHVMNFLAVDKAPKADWEDILPDIKAAFQVKVRCWNLEKTHKLTIILVKLKLNY